MTKKQTEKMWNVYKKLKEVVQENKFFKTRYDLISYCMGYYNRIDTAIYEAINRLYYEGYINE